MPDPDTTPDAVPEPADPAAATDAEKWPEEAPSSSEGDQYDTEDPRHGAPAEEQEGNPADDAQPTP